MADESWELWSDGSGNTKERPCAAGYVLARGGVIVDEGGVFLGNGSNNFAEIRAIGCGLRALMKHQTARGLPPEMVRLLPVRVYSDSEFAISAIQPDSSWQIRASEELRELVTKARGEIARWKRLTLHHVEGHKGHAYNERADRFAGAARKLGADVRVLPEKEQKQASGEIPLVFFDTETSGLSVSKHQILELAAIISDPTGQEVRGEFLTKILLEPGREVDPGALAINGHSPYDKHWQRDARTMAQALEAFEKELPPYFRLVAHNARFDMEFLRASYGLVGRQLPIMHPSPLCTYERSKYLSREKILPNVKLATLCEHFGIKNERAHTAFSDVCALQKVYQKLVQSEGSLASSAA